MPADKPAFDPNPPDPRIEMTLRPALLDQFVGQVRIKERLDVLIGAAKQRDDSLEHLLFCGPPGLGKTSLAHIVAKAMGANITTTSGPVIEKAGDLAGLLTTLQKGDVLFIDEIHRLNKNIEEYLYPAMEDFRLDIIIDQGPNARSVRLNLPRFTLIGATTRAGMISAPLRSRFGPRQPARLLSRRRPQTRHPPLRAPARTPHRGSRRIRDRPPFARHAPHREQPAPLGARLRPRPLHTARHRRRR